MSFQLTAQTKLLFIGDSITDCGRRTDEEKVGHGYVRLIRDWLLSRDPANSPQIINTGISGNKMPDLQKRWDRDVLQYKPDILSIKIGVNDVWHGLLPDHQGCDLETFTAGYRDILTQLKKSLPACKLVLCEPTVLDPPLDVRGNERLAAYVHAVHDMAREFSAQCVVPLHAAFVNARNAKPDVKWTTDGAHPTPLGHMLIARSWLATTKLL